MVFVISLSKPPKPTMILFLPVQVKDLWCCLGLNTHLPFKVFYNLNVSMILCHQYWPGVKSGDYIQFLEQRGCLLFCLTFLTISNCTHNSLLHHCSPPFMPSSLTFSSLLSPAAISPWLLCFSGMNQHFP